MLERKMCYYQLVKTPALDFSERYPFVYSILELKFTDGLADTRFFYDVSRLPGRAEAILAFLNSHPERSAAELLEELL